MVVLQFIGHQTGHTLNFENVSNNGRENIAYHFWKKLALSGLLSKIERFAIKQYLLRELILPFSQERHLVLFSSQLIR